jgi:hypothetical protein
VGGQLAALEETRSLRRNFRLLFFAVLMKCVGRGPDGKAVGVIVCFLFADQRFLNIFF